MSKMITKGDEIALNELDGTLKQLRIALGWSLQAYEGNTPVDLDASCFLLDTNNQTKVNEDFVFYNNLQDASGAVVHSGDNQSGVGEGDNEAIIVDLTKLSFDVHKIVFVISIYNAEMLEQDFKDLNDAYIRVANEVSGDELLRYDLVKDFEGGNALIFAALVRDGGYWKFRAIGDCQNGGLGMIAQKYNIIIA